MGNIMNRELIDSKIFDSEGTLYPVKGEIHLFRYS